MIAIEKRGPASDTGINILLVEDNPADVRMMVEALNVAEIPNRMFVVSDGEEALAFLRRENAFSGVPRPDVIVLDLKLPRKSGHEVLAAVKGDADLCTVPVVVLTSSRAEKDMIESYRLNADGFITKPVGLNALVTEVRVIQNLVKWQATWDN